MDFVQPRAPVGLLEQFLPLGGAQRRQVAGHEIGQPAGLGDLRGGGGQVVGEIGRGRHDLLEQADHVLPQRLHFRRDLRLDLRHALHARLAETARVAVNSRVRMRAMPSQNSSRFSLRHADGLVHHAHGADLVEVLRAGRIHARIELRDHRHGAVLAQRLHQRHRTGRPTVMGSMAPGKITVSRTVSTGISSRGGASLAAGSTCPSSTAICFSVYPRLLPALCRYIPRAPLRPPRQRSASCSGIGRGPRPAPGPDKKRRREYWKRRYEEIRALS